MGALIEGLAFREVVPGDWAPGGQTVLLVHGYPESSYMWRELLPALAGVGYRAVAPDLSGYGDSPPDPPGTWERHVESLERFRLALDLQRVVLITHDWGSLIGLRWACEHPQAVAGLVISNGGFFPDGKWHGMAQAMRTAGEGERLIEAYTRDGFAAAMKSFSSGIDERSVDEYWKGFADDVRRRGHLELYRSGDFAKLAPYDGRLAKLNMPTLIVWGAEDPFSPVAGAHRFHREIPGSELLVLDGAGHFVWEDEPRLTSAAVVSFLTDS